MAPNRVVLNVEAGGYRAKRSIEAEGSTWRAQSARHINAGSQLWAFLRLFWTVKNIRFKKELWFLVSALAIRIITR